MGSRVHSGPRFKFNFFFKKNLTQLFLDSRDCSENLVPGVTCHSPPRKIIKIPTVSEFDETFPSH